MLSLFRHLRAFIEDARLKRAAKRYQQQLSVIESLDVPDEFKRAAKDQALNRVGAQLEQYLKQQ